MHRGRRRKINLTWSSRRRGRGRRRRRTWVACHRARSRSCERGWGSARDRRTNGGGWSRAAPRTCRGRPRRPPRRAPGAGPCPGPPGSTPEPGRRPAAPTRTATQSSTRATRLPPGTGCPAARDPWTIPCTINRWQLWPNRRLARVTDPPLPSLPLPFPSERPVDLRRNYNGTHRLVDSIRMRSRASSFFTSFVLL